MAVRLCISGACGRMGKTIATLALEDSRFALTAALEGPDHPDIGKDYGLVLGRAHPLGIFVTKDLDAAVKSSDVVIEFTSPEATATHAGAVACHKKPLVIGTTGLDDRQVQALRAAAETIPVVFSPNMSIGMNVLFELAKIAAERFGLDYDVGVFEMHHKQKKDAPSGTAKWLVEALANGRKEKPSAIQAPYFRGGTIVGDHTVVLSGRGEYLELRHIALDRSIFAQGALRAARFIANAKQPGLMDMSDVLKSATA